MAVLTDYAQESVAWSVQDIVLRSRVMGRGEPYASRQGQESR